MTVQKNFVVKNGIEVNNNLIFADKDSKKVGIVTANPEHALHVNGGIGATSLVLTGIGTIPKFESLIASIDIGYTNVGVVTSITGTGLTYATGDFETLKVIDGDIISGIVTNLTGIAVTYTNSYFTNQNSENIFVDNLYVANGITTNGTVTNLTGAAATIGTVQIATGIITSTSGIVTYYGDGKNLSLVGNADIVSSTGVGIQTGDNLIGYGVTYIEFRGPGVSTGYYNSSGIATIFFEGAGGGAIGIGSTFPGTPLSIDPPPTNGDLFFHIDYGRTFIYYNEFALGIGTTSFWIDSSPFNIGIITSLTGGISFDKGTALDLSWYFIDDQTTGAFSPANGELAFVSSGSSILNINPSGVIVTGISSANSFIRSGGTSSQFLKADGSVDSNTYLTSYTETQTLNDVLNLGNTSSLGISIGIVTASSFIGPLTGNATGLSGTPNLNVGIVTATSFVKSGGTSSQFLKADGSSDSLNNLTAGSYITYNSGSTYNGSSAITISANGSSSNTANTLVARDASGNFSAGIITGSAFNATTTNAYRIDGTTIIDSNKNVNNIGVLTATSISDSAGDVRKVPQNSKTSSYTLVASDSGKHINITTGGIIVPANIFSPGDAITIFNNSSSNQTITQDTNVTLRFAGTSLTGNRTLLQYGICTILNITGGATPTFVISGAGLS